MSWNKFKTICVRIFPISFYCTIILWLLVELLMDSRSVPLWVSSMMEGSTNTEVTIGIMLTWGITFLGIGIPIILSLWLYHRLYTSHQCSKTRLPLFKALRNEMKGPAGTGLFVWFVCVFPLWVLAEEFAALSVNPLATPISAVLVTIIGYQIVKTMSFRRKHLILALAVAVLLVSEHIDWYLSKSLIRDMYHIRPGMTVAAVENLMASHKVSPAGPIENLTMDQANEEGHLLYMTPHSSDMVTVEIKAGKVAGINFPGD